MELIEYLKHLYRFKIWLAAGIIIGGLIGLVVALNTKEDYQAIVSLYIQRKTEQPSNEYFTYEGYYAQQTAVTHTDTVLKLLSTDEIISRAAHIAGLDNSTQQVSALKSKIVAKKDAPQLIKVTVTMAEHDTAANLASGLSQSIKQRTTELNQFGDNSLSIEQVEDVPLVKTLYPSKIIYAAVAGFVGLLIAIMSSALWSYLRQQRRAK